MEPTQQRTSNSGMPPTILIIKDDPIQQKLYNVLGKRYGYDAALFS